MYGVIDKSIFLLDYCYVVLIAVNVDGLPVNVNS